MSDEELMTAYQSGESEAFMLLYERYSGKVYGFLSSRLNDRAHKDDVFQATFLKLHQSREKYDPALPFAPWLFTICRSVMIDSLRQRGRVQSNEILDELAVERAVALIEPEPSESLDLNGLPLVQKQALELRYLTGLSFEEIASRLETTSDNSRQLVSRAVRKLKKLLQSKERMGKNQDGGDQK